MVQPNGSKEDFALSCDAAAAADEGEDAAAADVADLPVLWL